MRNDSWSFVEAWFIVPWAKALFTGEEIILMALSRFGIIHSWISRGCCPSVNSCPADAFPWLLLGRRLESNSLFLLYVPDSTLFCLLLKQLKNFLRKMHAMMTTRANRKPIGTGQMELKTELNISFDQSIDRTLHFRDLFRLPLTPQNETRKNFETKYAEALARNVRNLNWPKRTSRFSTQFQY